MQYRDAKITFHICLFISDDTATASVLGLAAGVSVLLPIICVVFVHIVKSTCQKHRQSAAAANPETPRDEILPQNNDAPPSYETLFADGILHSYGSHEALLDISGSSRSPTRTSLHGHVNSTILESDESQTSALLPEQTSPLISPQNNPIFLISTGETSIRSPNATRTPLRLPGMHISLFDLLHYDDQLVTPPPTYDEAIIITEQMSKDKLLT